jgi:hypothetical protein
MQTGLVLELGRVYCQLVRKKLGVLQLLAALGQVQQPVSQMSRVSRRVVTLLLCYQCCRMAWCVLSIKTVTCSDTIVWI